MGLWESSIMHVPRADQWRHRTPVESRGEAAVEGLGKCSSSWSTLQTSFTEFDCRNGQHLKIAHNSPPDSWSVCFTVGAKRHLGRCGGSWRRHWYWLEVDCACTVQYKCPMTSLPDIHKVTMTSFSITLYGQCCHPML